MEVSAMSQDGGHIWREPRAALGMEQGGTWGPQRSSKILVLNTGGGYKGI